MRVSRVYYDGILRQGENILLPEETTHYILHVLRLKIGANLYLFNGDGKNYSAKIVTIQKKTLGVDVTQELIKDVASPIQIHLAQAISKSQKMDWTIQKAVELGVHQITPLITERCSISFDNLRIAKRLLHWKRIIISACEQSGRTTLPQLSEISIFKQWITQAQAEVKFFCDPSSLQSIAAAPSGKQVLILIGPEGGLSSAEISLAKENHFLGISLGPRVLRTETAALAAMAIIQSHWGDM